jgi:hypothetical protein
MTGQRTVALFYMPSLGRHVPADICYAHPIGSWT